MCDDGDRTHTQVVDFATFVALERRHPHICAGPNLIWDALERYAAPAAVLVRKLRLSGHIEFLAPASHSRHIMMTASMRRTSSNLRSAARRTSVNSNSSGGSAGSGKIRKPPSVPPLALSALRDDAAAAAPQAAHGAVRDVRGRAAPLGADDDDLDGFANWAERHGDERGQPRSYAADFAGRPDALRAASPMRRAQSLPREGSPSRRAPPLDHELRHSDPLGGAFYRGEGYATHSPSRVRAASPSRMPALDPQLSEVVGALSSVRSRSPRKPTERLTDDYYARMEAVAAARSRQLPRANSWADAN